MKLYNYKHELLAYLDDVNPSLEKILGGISTLSFVFYKDKYDNENGLMREDERYKYVVNEAVVEYDGEFFVIKNSTPIHDEYGVIYKEVSCKHMSVELSGTKIDGLWGFSPTVESFESPYNRPTTIYNAFSDLLKNHTNGWELGIIPDSEKRRTFEFEWVTPMQVIVDLSQVYGYTPHFRTEYKYGKICKYVDLLTDDYGEIKGYYRHESTLKSIRKPITSEGITTRLYVFGYNDITLNDIPTESRTINGTSYNIHEKGKSYIDNFDYYLKQGYTYEECLKYFIKTDVVRDDLYVDPEDLYTFGKEHIEKVAMPNVSYTVVITDIDFIGKPEIEIGHKIRIYDDEMNVDLVGRVSKVSFSNDDKENKLIEISNYYTLLEEVDLLTDMVIKQNTLQTRAIKRYSKFANSIVINDSTGIIVQSDRQDLINPNSRMAEDHIPYYRDVVRIGEYEYGKYGIQILDGELQMDRYDNKTRVLINNDDGFVMYRDKDGNGEFGDNERVFWVDYDGIAHANGFTITNSDIFVGEGETIMDRFDTVTETIDGVKETTTNLSTVVNQTAEQVSLKANKTEVSELRGVVDGYEERIQQAELKVTADAIISTVSETVESAKTEAINTSSQYVDGQLVNYYTKTESDSKIEQTASSVAIEVANTRINNLQIGGANLLLNSDEKKELNRAEPNTYNHISYNLVDDYVGLTLNNDTTFVLSFMVDRTGNTEFECFDTITFDNGWAHRWTRSDIDKITLIQGSTYKFVMKPKTLPKGATIADKLYFIAENYYGGGLFYKLMLTESEKAFDWQPALKDIEASIARIDVKSDEINLSVNQVKENLSNNYPTTSQMNSALQQKANEITLSVSETYTTKDEVKGTYATKSELSQSSDNLTIKFSNSSSGGNLVANGDFLNGRDNWWTWGDTQYYLNSIPDCSIGARLGSNGVGGFVSNQFRIKPNTKYTLSFDGYVEVNVIEGYAIIEMLDGNGGNRGAILIHRIGRTLEKNIIHLTTGSDVGTDWKAQVAFKHEGSRVPNNGYLMVLKNVCLTEGHNSGQYVPSTKTLYEGVTRIDKDGITVTHSADSSYSTMSATGFTFNSHGSGHRYHNLMKQGWIDTISFGGIGANGWSTTITLPPEFKNKPFSVIPAITYVGCPHIADAVKMFEINIPHGEVNYANGTFKIYIYASGLWAEGLSTTYSVEVRATWVAIA